MLVPAASREMDATRGALASTTSPSRSAGSKAVDTAGGAVRDAPAQRYPAAKAASTVTTQREFTNGRDIVCGLDSGSLQSRQLGASSNTGRSWAPSSAEEIAQADVSLASAGRRESLSE